MNRPYTFKQIPEYEIIRLWKEGVGGVMIARRLRVTLAVVLKVIRKNKL